MVPEHRQAHLALWADIVRRADGPWLPAPASLLAFTAWQAGDGTLANIALDRALAADPGYSMALLLRDILAAGVPPVAGAAADDAGAGCGELRTRRGHGCADAGRTGKRRTAPGEAAAGRAAPAASGSRRLTAQVTPR